MAKTEKQIRGRVGNTVFYQVGNETRVRSTASQYTDANTEEQQANRSRLRVAIRFYQRLAETLLRDTWTIAAADSGKSGYNLFMKRNMTVFTPDGKIGDFSLLQLAEGILQKVNHLSVVADSEDTVTLTWENNANISPARATDRLIVVVLHENRSFSPTVIEGILAIREDEKATFRLNRKQGTTAHLYCFFKAKDGKAYSPSQYLKF